MNATLKKVYETPRFTEVGSFEDITLAKNGSNHIDSTFTVTIPAGLPIGDLPGYIGGIVAAHTS